MCVRQKASRAEARHESDVEHGVPVGGVGAGSVGRGRRGDFARWQALGGGRAREALVVADQFSAFVSRETEGQVPRARVLNAGGAAAAAAPITPLSDWAWRGDDKRADDGATRYRALYPRAWTEHDDALGVEGLRLECRQLSPVVAHEYRDSAAPVGVFVWRVVNESAEDCDVSLMLSFRNGDGSDSDVAGGHHNEAYRATLSDDGVLEDEDGPVGVLLLRHKRRTETRDKAGRLAHWSESASVALAAHSPTHADATVTACQRWRPDSEASAGALWRQFARTGELCSDARVHGAAAAPSEPGEAIGGAVAIKMAVGAGETAECVFVLAWHAPLVRFGGTGDAYWRRYTKFYGRDAAGIKRLVASALLNWRAWERAIAAWQAPIIERARAARGDDYAAALLNELHWLTEGGSVWTDGGPPVLPSDPDLLLNNDALPVPHTDVPRDSVAYAPPAAADGAASGASSSSSSSSSSRVAPDVVRSEAMRGMPPPLPGVGVPELRDDADVGHFLLLASDAEPVYNGVEANFYANSWALLQCFPRLELSMQRDAATALFMQDRAQVPLAGDGGRAPRKLAGAVAHDLGAPDAAPWRQLNAHGAYDVNESRDLPAMYVLTVYRDFVATGDRRFAADVWPAVEQSIEHLQRFSSADTRQDGLLAHRPAAKGGKPGPYDTQLGVRAAGAGAYINSLWLAALAAALALASALALDDDDKIKRWRALLARGKTSFHSALWDVTAQQYAFDTAGTHPGQTLVSQLVGQFYADACGLAPLVDREHVRAALETVFAVCVVQHGGGERGAARLATNAAASGLAANSKTGGLGADAAGASHAAKRIAEPAHVPSTLCAVAGMRLAGLADEARITLSHWLRTVSALNLDFATPTVLALDGRVRGQAGMAGLWAIYFADQRDNVPASVAAELVAGHGEDSLAGKLAADDQRAAARLAQQKEQQAAAKLKEQLKNADEDADVDDKLPAVPAAAEQEQNDNDGDDNGESASGQADGEESADAEEAAAVAVKQIEDETEAKRVAEEEAAAKRKPEDAGAKRKTEEEAEAKRKAEEEAEAKRKAEEEEVEANRKAEEEAEAQRKAEEEAEAKRKAKRKAEEAAEAKRKAEEEAEAKRKAEEEAEAKRKAEEEAEAKRKAEEEAERQRKAEEEAEAKRKAGEEEAEAKCKAEEEAEAQRKAEEEAKAKRKAEEEAEAKRKAEEEAEAKHKAEEEAEAKRKAKEEAEIQRKAEEEAEAKRKAEEEAAADVAKPAEEEAASSANEGEDAEAEQQAEEAAGAAAAEQAEQKAAADADAADTGPEPEPATDEAGTDAAVDGSDAKDDAAAAETAVGEADAGATETPAEAPTESLLDLDVE